MDSAATHWLELVEQDNNTEEYDESLTLAVGEVSCRQTVGEKGMPVCKIAVPKMPTNHRDIVPEEIGRAHV